MFLDSEFKELDDMLVQVDISREAVNNLQSPNHPSCDNQVNEKESRNIVQGKLEAVFEGSSKSFICV